ncbi:MAG: alpha/beta hydrolase [Solirubrobacterales bacterium]
MRAVHVEPPEQTGHHEGLAYAVFLPEGEPAGSLVVLHGAGSSKESHFDFARRARSAGIATACFDQRGHGESEGSFDRRFVDDVGEIASLLPPGPLGLRGSSMGGYVALVAAAPVGASAVIAICPAPGRGLAAGLRVGAFDFAADPAVVESLEEADELEAVRSLRCPLLLLHAEEDEVVPFALSERLVDVAPEGLCRFVAVPGGHHRSIQHDAEFQDLSVRFLLESFAR